MQNILISILGSLVGTLCAGVGMFLLLFNLLPGLKQKESSLAQGVRKRRIVVGGVLFPVGVALALAAFAFGFFSSLPGPSFSESWSAASEYLRQSDPKVTVSGLRIASPLNRDEASGESFYDMRVRTNSGEIKLRLWFDPQTKKKTRIEKTP